MSDTSNMSPAGDPIEWAVSSDLVDYDDAVAAMEKRAAAIREGAARECVWLLEHPPLYTAGSTAKAHDLRDPSAFPVYKSSRGGQYTYHGPGQRIAYVMLDVAARGRDVRAFVAAIEQWVIETLAVFNVRGERRDGLVGVWVDRTSPGGAKHEDKIAAIGVRLRRWVSFHGVALNVEPNLSHFDGIVPCGVDTPGLGVTSLVDLGLPVVTADVDAALRTTFANAFGPSTFVNAAPPTP
ncbi:MAG: lipoyl(octanoyl) transferase LipB [Pseudomonadota bacterium]